MILCPRSPARARQRRGRERRHIPTAIGRDHADIAPIDGMFVGQSGQSITVSVGVAPVGSEA